MRVLHVIPSAATADGGPNRAVRSMARELARRGVEVTVATTNADGSGSLDVPVETPVLEEGVAFRYFPRTVSGDWKFSWPLTRWLWRNVPAYDVVHVHALFSYATIPGCRTAARVPVPYVLRPLGTLSEWSLAHRAWKKRPYFALVERRHLTEASAIHVTSDAEGDDVRRLGFGERVRVIPLGVDVPERAPRRTSATGRPLQALFLSRLHPKKNIPLLLDALVSLRASNAAAVELTIAGDGERGYRESLEAHARQRGLADSARFVGQVEGDRKRALLARSDCFVLASAHENFGIAVAEAMAAGLPVIVSPGVALADAVRDADAGLVVAPEAAEVAGALAWCAANPAPLAEMGARAREYAARNLSSARTAELLEALYRELARGAVREGRSA